MRKAGNRVRITAQLVKTSDGFHLWSETFDRVLDDVFAVQDEIARAVSSAMNVALLGPPVAPALPTVAARLDVLLQASISPASRPSPRLSRAAELYRAVLDQSPDDARAWAGLARVVSVAGGAGIRRGDGRISQRPAAAEKALALDDSLADAHESLGFISPRSSFAGPSRAKR